MDIKKKIKSMMKYVKSLKKIYLNLSDFELTVIKNAYMNGYKDGYNQRIEDCRDEIDSQENIYAYES